MQPTLLPTPRRGRPSKFGRPAQPVTITLPDDIVTLLRSLDPDLSRAIVRLSESAAARLAPRPAVELAHYGRNAVIVVTPSTVLRRLPGVSLVPLPDGRALISLDAKSRIAEFEVLVRDAVEANSRTPAERSMLDALGQILRAARQSRNIALCERSIIVLERQKTRNGRTVRRGAS
jgi:hypothetical protein